MLWLISAIFSWVRSFFRSRHDLGLEIVALRHQLAVLKRSTKRARLHPTDRLLWVLLRRFFPRLSFANNPSVLSSRCDAFITMVKAPEFRDLDNRALLHDLTLDGALFCQRQVWT